MIAPSEKHLEDYIWAHPEFFGAWDDDPECYGDLAGQPEYKMLWRQFPLPSGIVDLVMMNWQIALVELKRDVIDAKAVVQIVRYMADMRRMMDTLLWDYFIKKEPRHEQLLHCDIVNGSLFDQLVHGYLVGYSIKDDDLYIACAEANITVALYEVTNDGRIKASERDLPERIHNWFADVTTYDKKYLSSPMAGILRNLLQRELTRRDRSIECRFDAVDAACDYLDGIEGGEV